MAQQIRANQQGVKFLRGSPSQDVLAANLPLDRMANIRLKRADNSRILGKRIEKVLDFEFRFRVKCRLPTVRRKRLGICNYF